jgi:hypothetical protein
MSGKPDPNHDIVPSLRMFDGLMMNLAADEIERLRPLAHEAKCAQAAADENRQWFEANKARLHAADCSYHEPSARCSCGLHKVLSFNHAIANGNAAMFVEPKL